MLLEQGRLDGRSQLPSLASLQETEEMDDDLEDDVSDDDEYDEAAEEEAVPAPSQWQNGKGSRKTSDAVNVNDVREKGGVPRKGSEPSGLSNSRSFDDSMGSTSPDVVDRGSITVERAQALVDRFIGLLIPQYPAIIIPPGTLADDLRREKPCLFLAICAAAAGDQDPALNLNLNQEVMQMYAKKVALNGEKSLELVQSMLISVLWYYPPERFEELKFHQYIHMSATMAMDLGMGRRPRNRDTTPVLDFSKPAADPTHMYRGPRQSIDSTTLESRRTIMGCYLSCSSVSISLRMPNFLRFTSWMDDCLKVLETSPEAAPTDRRLAAWVRIQRLVEECNVTFSLDDPGSDVSLADHSTAQTLKGYERQFETLRRQYSSQPGLVNGEYAVETLES